jgi:hypothetical protein
MHLKFMFAYINMSVEINGDLSRAHVTFVVRVCSNAASNFGYSFTCHTGKCCNLSQTLREIFYAGFIIANICCFYMMNAFEFYVCLF